jgi:signal peptidase I
VADGKLGWRAVLGGVLLRPRRFFESVRAGEVGVRPFWVYLVVLVIAAGSAGVTVGRIADQRPLWVMTLLVAATQLLVAPIGWFFDVRITHLLARLLRGRGTLPETKAAVGFSVVPHFLALVPYGGFAAVLWAVFIKIQALRILHGLKLGRAVLAGVASMIALLVLPVGMAVGLRLFVLEAFKVPAGSMFPSVEIGDHLFVSKASYGVFAKSAPARGDVVVFLYPERKVDAPRVDYIKRVVGLPNDELVFESGAPVINGWHVPRCRLGTVTATLGSAEIEPERQYEIFVEFLEASCYLVAFETERDDGRQGPYRVKPGEFWVLGDNRNNSSDSRVWNAGRGDGVPFENARGRARWLWLPPERFGIDLAGAPVLPRSLQRLQPELERCLTTAPDLAHRTPPAPK